MLLQHGLHLHAHCTPQSLSVPVGIGIKGGRCLEALTSSCPTIFLATGTNRAVEVKLGSATRPYFLEEYILEWSNHMCNWTTSVFARVAAYDHLAISFGCGRWEVERRKLHPAPGQPIIVGYELMDKGFPLSSDNVCPRSVIPRASTPPQHWRKKKKKNQDIYWNQNPSLFWYREFWNYRQQEKMVDAWGWHLSQNICQPQRPKQLPRGGLSLYGTSAPTQVGQLWAELCQLLPEEPGHLSTWTTNAEPHHKQLLAQPSAQRGLGLNTRN